MNYFIIQVIKSKINSFIELKNLKALETIFDILIFYLKFPHKLKDVHIKIQLIKILQQFITNPIFYI
jgi:hypothetical protein